MSRPVVPVVDVGVVVGLRLVSSDALCVSDADASVGSPGLERAVFLEVVPSHNLPLHGGGRGVKVGLGEGRKPETGKKVSPGWG